MRSYTESDSDQKREVERDAHQVDQERRVIVEADTRVDPRTVMVKSVDALAAGVAMLCSLALDHFTGEAKSLSCLDPLGVRLTGACLLQDCAKK